MIDFGTWPPFLYYKGSQVTKPIILVKMCYKLNYCRVRVRVMSLIGDFLASADIKDFGHFFFLIFVYIGSAASYWHHTFFTPRVLYHYFIATLWKHTSRCYFEA